MNNEKLKKIQNRILEVFPKNEPLPCIYLTAHRCDECDKLRDDFCEKKWWIVDGNLIIDNYDKLPLFTAPAFHYYLPSFLLYALDTFVDDNLIIEFIIYSLGPPLETSNDRFFRERRAFFSEEQSFVIQDFLKCIINNEEMKNFHESSERALDEFWQD